MGKTAIIIAGSCLVLLLVLPVAAWPAILDSGISTTEGAPDNMWGIGDRKEFWETGEWEQEKDIIAWIRIAPDADRNPVDDGPQYSWETRLISPQGTVYRELSFPNGFVGERYGVDSWVVHQLMKEPGWDGQWTCEFYLYDDYTETYELAKTLHFTLLPNTITPRTTDTEIPATVQPAPTRPTVSGTAEPVPVSTTPAKAPVESCIPLIAAGTATVMALQKIQR